VQSTDQPYVFVNGDPLNATDPLGLDPKKVTKKVAACLSFACGASILGQVGTIAKPPQNPDASQQVGKVERGIPEVEEGSAPSGQTYNPSPRSPVPSAPTPPGQGNAGLRFQFPSINLQSSTVKALIGGTVVGGSLALLIVALLPLGI
jgi:hypothetical protein